MQQLPPKQCINKKHIALTERDNIIQQNQIILSCGKTHSTSQSVVGENGTGFQFQSIRDSHHRDSRSLHPPQKFRHVVLCEAEDP